MSGLMAGDVQLNNEDMFIVSYCVYIPSKTIVLYFVPENLFTNCIVLNKICTKFPI